MAEYTADKAYITLEEASKLEGIGYEAFKKRFQRNQELYETIYESSQNGGKERVLVSVNSLTDKAQKVYKNQAKRSNLDSSEESAAYDEEDGTWYIGVDINWYMKKYKEKFYKAVELANKIERFLKYDGKGKTDFTEEYAQKLGMSSRTFRRKVDRYIEGMSAAMEMQELDGQNYDFYRILALCPTPRERKSVVLNEEMKTLIQNIWSDKQFQVNQRFQTKLYEAFKRLAIERGWEPVPSYPTVNRYVNYLKGTYQDAEYYQKYGPREFKRKKMIKRLRNTGSLKVMELVQGDAHTFDCWVKVTRDNGKVTAIKPVLCALIDTRSRVLVGWAICEVPNAQVIKQVIFHMMYEKKNSPVQGLPRILLIDNGKDWTAQTLTGRPRTERFDVDSQIKGFYKSVGIEDDMRSLPYQAWTKAQIERFFGTLCKDFTDNFNSYVGTLTGSKTTGKIKKDIPKMLEKDELLTMEEFSIYFEEYLNTKYHLRQHRGLKDQKEKCPVPYEVFKNAEKYFKAAPPEEFSRVQLLECVERRVTAVGIRAFGNVYQHESLGSYIDQWVDIRYDVNDLSCIHAYDKEGIKICQAPAYEGLNPIADIDDEELIEHIKQQKRQMRSVREKVKELQLTHEERQQRKVILPELTGEKQQIVSIPDDKQFRAEMKAKKKASKNENSNNEFFDKQAEKALAKLANIG